MARWDRIRSFTAKITTTLDHKDEQRRKHDGAGTLDCLKKGGKLHMNMRVYNNILIEQPDDKWLLTGQRLIKVSDGDVVYTVDQRHDGKTVTKTRAIPPQIRHVGGADLFARLHRAGRVTLLEDETIDGRAVHVFEVLVKGGATVTRSYMDKKTGVRLKLVVEQLDGKFTFTFALSDLKLNPEFSEDHFTFVPPDDVELEDLTQRGNRVTPRAGGP